MPEQTRDHRRAAWVSTGGRRGIAHLVAAPDNLPDVPKPAKRKTLCGKTETAVWTPVIPGELVKCMACSKYAAKRSMTIAEPS